MSLIKSLFKYLIILIALLALGTAILASVMFFVPSVKIFGFRFKASHTDHNLTLIDSSDIKKITIITTSYDIIVKPTTSATSKIFSVVIKNDYTGYSNSENDEVLINGQKISEIDKFSKNEILENEIDEEGNIVMNGDIPSKIAGHYIIDLTELEGLLALGGSSVTLYVPQTTRYVDYNLKTKNGTISFPAVKENAQKVKTNNLNISISSARGTFSLDNVEMISTATLEVENFLGRIEINSDIGGSVKISSHTGSFKFRNIGTEGVSKIENESIAGAEEVMLLITGNNPEVSFKKLNGSLKLTCPSGFIKGELVSGDIISNSENASIQIAKLLGGCIIQSENGYIGINQIGENTTELRSINISTTAGEIKLGDEKKVDGVVYGGIYGKISTIVTASGKVNLNNVLNDIGSISTNSGVVNITFVKNDTKKDAQITTKSGAITINNINGSVIAETKNSAPIKANFYLIGGNSSFTTDDGNIDLTIFAPTNETKKQYTLNMKSKSNNFDCQIGAYTLTKLDEESKVEGHYETKQSFPSTASSAKILSLKTNMGKIIVGY